MESVYGKITASDLRSFLNFWPTFQSQSEGLKASFVIDKDILFTPSSSNFSWCHLYELSAIEHFQHGLKMFKEDEEISNIINKFEQSQNKLLAIPEASTQIDSYFDSLPPLLKSEARELLGVIAPLLGVSLSVYNSLVSLLYYGRFLNDLIEQVRLGDEKALFHAISIDPTCIGCKPIVDRMSRAVFIQDNKFLTKISNKLGQKPASLAQANYQKMRLILEILYECGASRLTDEELYKLFVKELDLYYWDDKNGGNSKALRKFADTYMKKQATT